MVGFRAILSADWHVRSDTEEELGMSLRLFDDAGMLALAQGCKHVIIAGDVFHHKHRLDTRILVSVYEKLAWWKDRGVSFILVRGNHDIPDTNQPEWTPLKLFTSVAVIIASTRVVEEEDCVIAFVPWYPAEILTAEIQVAANAVMHTHKPRILISHTSLREGKVSPSNTRITTPVRAINLLPSVWTGGIYLGDYHAAQDCGSGIRYLGAPRPTTFGDFDCLGMWLLEPSGITLLKLPSRYPAFVTHRVDSKADLPLKNYDSRNRNRIYIASKMVQAVSTQYPGVALIQLDEEDLGKKNRMEGAGLMSPIEVAIRWREGKRLGANPYDAILRRLLS